MLLHVYLFSLSGFYVDGLSYSVHSIIEHAGVPHTPSTRHFSWQACAYMHPLNASSSGHAQYGGEGAARARERHRCLVWWRLLGLATLAPVNIATTIDAERRQTLLVLGPRCFVCYIPIRCGHATLLVGTRPEDGTGLHCISTCISFTYTSVTSVIVTPALACTWCNVVPGMYTLNMVSRKSK
jgi:hypothetical protein